MSKKQKISTKTIIMVIIIIVIVLLLAIFFIIRAQSKQHTSISKNSYLNANIQVKTYKAESGWGYDIYENNKLLIHQSSIPALPGNNGFTTQADAQKVAKLIVDKIKGNIMPPTLTLEDLKTIGIEK